MKIAGMEERKQAAYTPRERNLNDQVKTASTPPKQETDVIQLSKEAITRGKQISKAQIDRIKQDAESAKEQAERDVKAIDTLKKCRIIARRILHGDKVPKEDERYLLKYQPDLYMQALSMRMQNDDPKKHKRLTEDKEDEQRSSAQVDAMSPDDSAPEGGVASADSAAGSEMQT